MQWIGGPVALRRRLDHSEATPATLGSPSTDFVTDWKTHEAQVAGCPQGRAAGAAL